MISQYCSILASNYGRFAIFSSPEGITRVELCDEKLEERENHHTFLCRSELIDYFDGRLKDFSVNVDITRHTPFHQSVWNALKDIPYGTTCSYMDIARKINNEKAIRAVGRANGANPIPFIIPCHRVIGSAGSLTGYASGLEMKRKLLSMENPINFPLQHTLF